ncbi:glycosyltransferase [bacterium]|nr:glycosyltransferase [bacterium]
MPEFFSALLNGLHGVVFGLMVFQVGYLLVFATAAALGYRTHHPEAEPLSMAILIPGYKEDRIIRETVRSALAHDYPSDRFRVVVLADQFQPDTLEQVRQMGAEAVEVRFEQSTKAKSLNLGLTYLAEQPGTPEAVFVLDADNLMEPGVLRGVSNALQNGYRAVQAHRTARNTDTAFALLDSANEEIGNSLFRSGHRKMGLPSALIGSGMGFEFGLFRQIMNDIRDVSGEDKLIDLKLAEAGIDVEFLPGHKVLDEKVSNSKNFTQQRTRWVGVQIYFFKRHFWEGFRKLFQGNSAYFDKVLQLSLIPKVLLMGLLFPMGLLDAVFGWPWFWWELAALLALSMLLALPRKLYTWPMFKAVLTLPMAFIGMVKAIARIDRTTAVRFEVTPKEQGGE